MTASIATTSTTRRTLPGPAGRLPGAAGDTATATSALAPQQEASLSTSILFAQGPWHEALQALDIGEFDGEGGASHGRLGVPALCSLFRCWSPFPPSALQSSTHCLPTV